MNPGAAGKHGFHQVRTMLRFEIDGDKIQQLEVIEIREEVSWVMVMVIVSSSGVENFS
jgi:hypothetical protein